MRWNVVNYFFLPHSPQSSHFLQKFTAFTAFLTKNLLKNLDPGVRIIPSEISTHDMAQSAHRDSRKTHLSIVLLLEMPKAEPPWALMILGKRNIFLYRLLVKRPDRVRFTQELNYEEEIKVTMNRPECGRQIRNAQIELQWEFKCQKWIEIGGFCGDSLSGEIRAMKTSSRDIHQHRCR